MKIEITIPTPGVGALRPLGFVLFVCSSILISWQLGLAAFLLFVAFCLLLLAISLSWASVTSFAEREVLTLEEALDVAAPARDEERKLAVLRGIKDLEYERSLGKVSEQDYAELMQRYRSEAKALLQRLDTSEASLRERALELAKARLERRAPLEGQSAASPDPSSTQGVGDHRLEGASSDTEPKALPETTPAKANSTQPSSDPKAAEDNPR